MLPQDEPGKHDQPYIKRRFVGIGLTLERKGEYTAVPDGLVGYLEVPQLVIRVEVPQDHHRQQAEGDQDESYYEGIPIHVPFLS